MKFPSSVETLNRRGAFFNPKFAHSWLPMEGKRPTVEEKQREQPPPKRKTRYLPDLYNCHGCKSHVSNVGEDKLRILTSEWRIILLCKRCFGLAESAKICSYCFSATSSMTDDCIRCLQCARMVHKDCVLQCRDFAPWSYHSSSSSGAMDFSICIDCWIPSRLLSNSRRDANKMDGKIKIAGASCLMRKKSISRVSENLDVTRDANCVAKQKIAQASRARGNASKKAAVARRALELASKALELVANRDGSCGDAAGAVNVPKLALRLHQAKNVSSVNIASFATQGSQSPAVHRDAEKMSTNRPRESSGVGSPDAGTNATNEECHLLVNEVEGKIVLPLKGEEESCSNELMIGSEGNDTALESEAPSCQKDDAIGAEVPDEDFHVQWECKSKAREDLATRNPETGGSWCEIFQFWWTHCSTYSRKRFRPSRSMWARAPSLQPSCASPCPSISGVSNLES